MKVGQPFSFQYLLYKYFSLLYANPLKVFVYLCHSCTSDKLSFSFLQFACDRQSGQMVCKQLPLVTTLIMTFVNLRKIPYPNSTLYYEKEKNIFIFWSCLRLCCVSSRVPRARNNEASSVENIGRLEGSLEYLKFKSNVFPKLTPNLMKIQRFLDS